MTGVRLDTKSVSLGLHKEWLELTCESTKIWEAGEVRGDEVTVDNVVSGRAITVCVPGGGVDPNDGLPGHSGGGATCRLFSGRKDSN